VAGINIYVCSGPTKRLSQPTKELSQKILDRVEENERQWVCSAHDFLDLGSRSVVQKALARLAKENKLRRIVHGLYDKPTFSTLLGKIVSPYPEEVMKAISRKTGHRFYMIGAKAANLMGLCNQVPARVAYITDWSSRTLNIGGFTIELYHASPFEIEEAGKPHGIVFQALRNIGKEYVTPAKIAHLQRILPREVKEEIGTQMPLPTDWLYPVLQKIIQEEKP
jgi:hypothetical protein